MIILGLTGSIGMGKTTIAGMLKKLGCAVHNSDVSVHEALSPNGEAFEEVAVTFPEAWDKKTHTIKRKVLGDIIFNDENKKQELEKILHPIVQRSQTKFIQKQKLLGKKVVVLDIPLLFETGAEERVHHVIVVSAPYHIQRRRVLSRPNMSEEKFKNILASQMSDNEKRMRANFIVSTGMGLAYSYKQLKKIMKDITP